MDDLAFPSDASLLSVKGVADLFRFAPRRSAAGLPPRRSRPHIWAATGASTEPT